MTKYCTEPRSGSCSSTLDIEGWSLAVLGVDEFKAAAEKKTGGSASSTGANAVAVAARPAAKKAKIDGRDPAVGMCLRSTPWDGAVC